MTTPDLKKLAEVAQYYFHAYGMTRKGEHRDDGDHVYWVRYSDYATLAQEVETLRATLEYNEARLREWMLGHARQRREMEILQERLAHARQEALEEAAKVCTDHIAWLRQYDAEKMRTASTLLDAIRALQQHTGEAHD